MVDFPWLSSFNGVYNIDIDLYIYIFTSFPEFQTQQGMTPVLSWKIRVRFTTFFCGLVFWLSRRVPRWVISRTFPRRFQLKHRWKILGSKEHQCFDGRALAISTVSGYVFGLNAIWIWRGEWWQFLLIMFFCDCLFLPRSCGGKWSNLTSIGSVSKSGMQSFESCYVMVLNMFFYVFFLFGPGKLNLFWWNTGKLNLPVLINKHGFLLLWGGRGTFMIMRQKKRTFSFIQTDPFWGWCDVFVKFDSPTAALENSQRPSKEKAPETVPVKAPESVPVSPKNDPPVQHGYCCRGWGSTRVGRMMETIR